MSLAAFLPDPPYLLIPALAVIGGFVSATVEWFRNPEPDWPQAWVKGNVYGAGIAVLVLPWLLALGVD
jgi:hypothetical protein